MTLRGRAQVLWGASVLLVGCVAFVAGRAFAQPPPGPPPTPAELEYSIEDGEVGLVQAFTAQASWSRSAATPTAASGTITSIDIPADGMVNAGSQLMSVNLRPVIVAVGAVPAFRALARGATGPDVAQLQELLRAEGHSPGTSGVFDAATATAVADWQRARGFPADGIVALGDVLFVPDLPRRVATVDGVALGTVVSPGQAVLEILSETPIVTVTLDQAQADTVPQDGEVVVRAGDAVWNGVVARGLTADDGSLILELTAADGGPICGTECAQAIPAVGKRNLPVEIVVTPNTRGPVVPTSAIRTGPDGETTVRVSDGTETSVTIVASARGLAVVEGVEAGEVILVPASEGSG